jgi:hypothetical protein
MELIATRKYTIDLALSEVSYDMIIATRHFMKRLISKPGLKLQPGSVKSEGVNYRSKDLGMNLSIS